MIKLTVDLMAQAFVGGLCLFLSGWCVVILGDIRQWYFEWLKTLENIK